MKYCAVICEYNPFHSGHAYQLDRAVKETAADGVIAVMSGPFVQRAEPASSTNFYGPSAPYATAPIWSRTARSHSHGRRPRLCPRRGEHRRRASPT